MNRTARYCFAIPFALGTALAFAPALHARQAASQPARTQAQRPVETVPAADANETRRAFEEILRAVPPDLGRILRLDPSLLENQQYLAPYPGLWEFVQQHPEIRQNPGYFFENVRGAGTSRDQDLALARLRARDDLLSGTLAFAVFLVVTGVVLWLTRLIVEQRRWNRISKIQADAHNKLLDKFATNEDLVAYIQTPAGRRFLESAPIPLREAPPAIGAPYSRILWSLQAGIVLVLGGLGLLVASRLVPDEPGQVFGFFGVVTIAVGAGFVASSGAAYALARKLGLFEAPSTDHA